MTTLAFSPAIFTQQQAAQAAAVIIKRVMATSQPQHPAGIDWSNPIARGLTLCTTGSHRLNHASGSVRAPAGLSGVVVTESTSAGLASRVADAAGFAQSISHPVRSFGNADVTALLLGRPVATAERRYAALQTGAIGRVWFAANSDENETDVSGQLVLGLLQTGVNRSSIKVAGAIDGTMASYIVRKVGATGQAFKNGAPLTVTTSGTLTGAPTAAADTTQVLGDAGNGAVAFRESLVLVALWNRALSDAEIRSISANPWQIFSSTRPRPFLTAQVAFDGKYRPSADISDGTWTRTPSGPDLYSAIDEPTPDDLDFITSPISGSTPTTMSIGPIPAGSQTLRIRAGTSSGTATLTVELLNDSNTVLATQTQSIGSTTTTYTLNFTLAAPATRVRIGVA